MCPLWPRRQSGLADQVVLELIRADAAFARAMMNETERSLRLRRAFQEAPVAARDGAAGGVDGALRSGCGRHRPFRRSLR
jgi:hypothetical protein